MTVRFVDSWDARRDFSKWLRELPTWEWLACDTETTGLNPWKDKLRLVQFGSTQDAWALPYPEEEARIGYAFERERGLVGWNSKFDEQFLINAGYEPRFTDDAKFMAHLLFSEEDLHLKSFADKHLGADSSKAQAELKAIAKKLKVPWMLLPTNTYEYWFYGGVDTILTARAAEYCYQLLTERGFEEQYDMELAVWKIVQAAEQRGIGVDLAYCAEQQQELEKQAAEIAGFYPDVNLLGRKDVTQLLLDAGARLPKTPSGQAKLDAETLEGIDHPIAADIVKYRKLLKNAHTYFRAFQDLAVDGRIHTTLKTMEARTGRMSSSIPNLQNVPKREAGAYVRRAFVARPGCTLVAADYDQIEYRIFASMAQEQKMIDAFLEGKDMHAVTAELTLGHEPSKKERDMAKNGNFSELYLAGISKFAATAGISEDAAARFKKAYHQEFRRIKPFTRALIRWAQNNMLCVYTATGRRIGVDANKVYAAVNYDIQGTAADVLKQGLIRISATSWINYYLLSIHDEHLFEVPDEEVDAFVAILPSLMEDRDTFVVPLTVSISTGKRWGELEEV